MTERAPNGHAPSGRDDELAAALADLARAAGASTDLATRVDRRVRAHRIRRRALAATLSLVVLAVAAVAVWPDDDPGETLDVAGTTTTAQLAPHYPRVGDFLLAWMPDGYRAGIPTTTTTTTGATTLERQAIVLERSTLELQGPDGPIAVVVEVVDREKLDRLLATALLGAPDRVVPLGPLVSAREYVERNRPGRRLTWTFASDEDTLAVEENRLVRLAVMSDNAPATTIERVARALAWHPKVVPCRGPRGGCGPEVTVQREYLAMTRHLGGHGLGAHYVVVPGTEEAEGTVVGPQPGARLDVVTDAMTIGVAARPRPLARPELADAVMVFPGPAAPDPPPTTAARNVPSAPDDAFVAVGDDKGIRGWIPTADFDAWRADPTIDDIPVAFLRGELVGWFGGPEGAFRPFEEDAGIPVDEPSGEVGSSASDGSTTTTSDDTDGSGSAPATSTTTEAAGGDGANATDEPWVPHTYGGIWFAAPADTPVFTEADVAECASTTGFVVVVGRAPCGRPDNDEQSSVWIHPTIEDPSPCHWSGMNALVGCRRSEDLGGILRESIEVDRTLATVEYWYRQDAQPLEGVLSTLQVLTSTPTDHGALDIASAAMHPYAHESGATLAMTDPALAPSVRRDLERSVERVYEALDAELSRLPDDTSIDQEQPVEQHGSTFTITTTWSAEDDHDRVFLRYAVTLRLVPEGADGKGRLAINAIELLVPADK